ncbi:hypothetical protein [Chitinophaga sp. Cy-1792]|uniref:hypothetical protein n=1 Tax=Chitinophaga sp. Cy-1792 TaxID=2608339 RepID=UPI00142413E9|nr:hypothetical protein [Chitinophaga sp. Cy-1792]NIG56502.1 hypothetical protein [Chitinophaga sp. Cy-1792]
MSSSGSIVFFLAMLILVSCGNKIHPEESPLAIVAKLISAESLADFEEAKKFIDVEKVYANHPDTLSAEQAWKTQVTFFYDLGRDKKFTNIFKYYNYTIKEAQNGENASVVFESKTPGDSIDRIIYKLRYYNKTWVVVGIEYHKKV